MLVFGSMFGVKLTNLTVTQFFDPSILTTILSPVNSKTKSRAFISCEEVTGRSFFQIICTYLVTLSQTGKNRLQQSDQIFLSNCVTCGSTESMLILIDKINNKYIFSKNTKCTTYYEDSLVKKSKCYDYF